MRASGGARNKDETGVGIPPQGASSFSAGAASLDPSSKFFCFLDGDAISSKSALRLLVGEEGARRAEASSRDFLTSRARIVRARTISNARKPRMSMVSSERSSNWEGRLRYSLKRLARVGVSFLKHSGRGEAKYLYGM